MQVVSIASPSKPRHRTDLDGTWGLRSPLRSSTRRIRGIYYYSCDGLNFIAHYDYSISSHASTFGDRADRSLNYRARTSDFAVMAVHEVSTIGNTEGNYEPFCDLCHH